MDVADPAFPRATAYWWFGCRSANKGTLGNVQWLRENPDDSFLHAGILESVGSDVSDDGDRNGDVGDIILDAGTKASFEPDQILTLPYRNSLLFASLSIRVQEYVNVRS